MGGSELMELVSAGASLVVGTVSADGEPRATRGWAVQVVDERTRRIRVVMGGDDQVSVENLKNGRVALTGADVRTLRSVQLKGRVVSTAPATDEDVHLVADHSGAFFRAVHETDGMPIALLERLLPATVVAVEFEVEEMFDQSPGPGAGSEIPR
jgi:Pyridoxamine 5'-phosphate oxidase